MFWEQSIWKIKRLQHRCSNRNSVLVLLVSMMAFPFFSSCTDKVKVACVGDSITYGYGLENRKKEAYPSVLNMMLPNDYKVKNFGHSGATALKESDLPYREVLEYRQVKKYQPDIIIFLLGTNDAKDYNWPGKDEFKNDYAALVDTLLSLDSSPQIFLCTPPPSFLETGMINNNTISDAIVPVIRQVAQEKGLEVIDFYSTFEHRPEDFPDKIHPNSEGTSMMAQKVHDQVMNGKG